MAKSDFLLSLGKLLRGVSETHQGVVKKVPESQKIPQAKRDVIEREQMTPAETVKFYSENEMVGKMPSGEPYAADLVRTRGIKRVDQDKPTLAKSGQIRFVRQGDLKRPVDDRPLLGEFNYYHNEGMERPKFYPGTARMLHRAVIDQPSMDLFFKGRPRVMSFETMNAAPGAGAGGYQMMMDVLRRSGDLKGSEMFSTRNVIRHPLNVANYMYSRGNLKNVMPVSERADSGFGSEMLISKVPGLPGSHVEQLRDIRQYLSGLLGIPDPKDPRISEILGLTSDDIAEMALRDPHEATGFLELLNSVRAAQARIPGFNQDVHPGDLGALKNLAEPGIMNNVNNRSGLGGAFGSGALGRARTTEEAVFGQRMGMTPDEIVERILRGSKDPSKDFAGRYRKGGLAALA
jgi:hypothetical protein